MILTLQTAIFLVYLTVHATSTVNVTFFGGKNFKLPKCEVVLSGCKPICANLVGKVISIKPSVKNTCMKFYTTADCSGAPPSYRGSINDLDGDGITDLIGTPAKEWKAIGDCKQSTGIPDNSVALFPQKKFKGTPSIVTVKGCTPVPNTLAGKSESFISNTQCCHLYATKNCTDDKLILVLQKTDFGTAYDDYDSFSDWKSFRQISAIGDCKQP
nr:PREDICTED: uncharacterized protein LOC109030001 isoform X1 [Bemisia tabaci]